jgi:hypothetical protein
MTLLTVLQRRAGIRGLGAIPAQIRRADCISVAHVQTFQDRRAPMEKLALLSRGVIRRHEFPWRARGEIEQH